MRAPCPGLLLAVLAAAAPGCGDDDAPPSTTCEVKGCPPGSTCTDSVCLADAPEDYRIAVRFVPPEGPAVAEWVGPRRVSELGGELPFKFAGRVLARGVVKRAAASLDAFVELERASPLPNRPPTVVARPVHAGQSFQVTVPRVPCRLTAWALDETEAFPPTRVDLSATDLEDNVEVQVPPAIVVRGTVLRFDGQRLENLRVWAVDAETGEALSASTLTSPLEGEASGGDFRLELPDSVTAFAVRVAESSRNAARAMPTIQSAELTVGLLTVDPEDGSHVIPLYVLVYPSIVQITLSGTVEGRPRAGGRVAVGGAMLRFSSDDLGAPSVPDVAGTMERIVWSDPADGTYQVVLPAGTYRVEITPPARSELADLAVGVVSQFVNGPDNTAQSGIVLEAPPRVAVGGTVESADGRPLEGAWVELRGGGELADVALARAEGGVRSVLSHTSAQGAFLALVDGGHFDAVVRPPPEAGLPWAVLLGLPVAEDTSLSEPLVVAPGQRLSGVVTRRRDPDESDEPGGVAGVGVEVWCLTDEDASTPCGRTTTDAAGRYSVLLPASLGAAPAPDL